MRHPQVFLAACVFALLCAPHLVSAETFKVLHVFKGGRDGANPVAGLVSDGAGNLYGASCGEALPGCISGGPGKHCSKTCGNIYGFVGGQEQTVHTFRGSDGAFPEASLLLSDGKFYGTTSNGGANDQGTVYQVLPDGTETVLYSFCSHRKCKDGAVPLSALIQDASGNFYGTTLQGGLSGCGFDGGCGTVFELSPDGKTETVLHTFCSQPNCTDGAAPFSGLVMDAAGNMYGTTNVGGANNSGTVFRIAPDHSFSLVYSFCSLQACADGSFPGARLTLGKDDNLYGTAGLVFKMTPAGAETVIYRFKKRNDGQDPNTALAIDDSGNLYGTTHLGGLDNCEEFGPGGCGTVFKITPDGKETLLYLFPDGPGGAFGNR